MFKRSISRGSSIVAALALVGVLSVALLLTQILLPNVNPASQKAEVGTAAQRGYGDFNSNAPENCTEAKQAALGKVFGPDTTNTDKGQSGTVDACFGAYSVTGKPSNDLKDYQCTGRAGTANFVNDMVIVKTSVSKLAPEGKCVVAMCKDGKCSGAKAFDGVNMSTYAANPSDPSTALVQNDGTGGEYSRTLSETESGTIRDAFSGTPETAQKALNDAQIAQNNQDLEELKQYINSCTETTCTTEDATLSQARLADIERQNAALQEQSDKFAADIKNDLTLKQQCDAGNCDARDLQTLAKLESNAVAEKSYNNLKQQCDAGNCDARDLQTLSKLREQATNNQTFKAGAVPAGSQQETPQEKSGGGFGNIGQALQGFLGGLMKGLGGAGAAQGPACPSDPNAYAAQQQQYQQQLQQYNYQMQQYQYQQQQMQYQAQVTGYVPMTQPTPPVAPVPCTPTSSSNTCAAAPPQPAGGCGTGYTIKPVTSNQSNGAACTTGWQCVPNGTSGTPTAQLSCQPQVADVGMTVTLSFGCTNATGSSGSGFLTLGAISGSTTTVLTAPPAGVNKATFGLTCINQNVTGQASCDVQISKPSIVLLANPKVVATSTASSVGWVTSGMSSCVISSPQQADFTAANASNKSVSGMATTSPITQATDILLHCVTLGGGTRDATTTITVGAAGSGGAGTAAVTSSADGKSIARGAVNTIRWSSVNPPSGSKMSLWLYDVRLGSVTGMIENELVASSTYNWTLPKPGDACAEDLNRVCSTDLVPGRQYGIEADLYTGSFSNPTYGAQAFTPDVFTVSQ